MESTLKKIEEFIVSNKLFSCSLNGHKKRILNELDLHAPALTLIFNYENLNPVYFSPRAKTFLGINDPNSVFDFSYLSSLIHPVSQRYILESLNFFKLNPTQTYKGPLLIMAEPLQSFTWLYTHVNIVTHPNPRKTKLICLVATDIEKLIGCSEQIENIELPVILTGMVPLPENLSDREKAIIKLICEELTSKEIADRLSCSVSTVEADRKKIMCILDVKSMVGVVSYAHRYKIV